MKTVFLTVGTTRFDELIESITSPENIQVRKCVLDKITVTVLLLFACTNYYCYFIFFYISILYIIMTMCAAY